MLDCLDAAAVRRWCAAGLDGLRRHQVEIDQLNVYPVPDGDTGTNLVLTVGSAWQALAAESPAMGASESEADGLARMLRCMARGALLGARGNSGVIVSQILRGAADALALVPLAKGRALAGALEAAAKAAYAAVAEPVEGTVLTVATAAAAGAAAVDTDDLPVVADAAARAAALALTRTPQQLPVLARAGVVDAGGRGLVVLLDALVEVITGRAAVEPPPPAAPARDPAAAATGEPSRSRESGSLQYAYEVQYLLEASELGVAALKGVLAGLGDSLVVVGAGGSEKVTTWKVHVHVNDVGAAIEAGIAAGRPHRIAVTRFADQAGPLVPGAGPRVLARTPDETSRGVVVVAPGPGLAAIFAAEAAVPVAGGPTRCPSTADVLEAILASGAAWVVLLPNDDDIHAVASAAAEQARAAGVRVAVIPTRSPVQALAALAVREASRPFHDDVIAMAEAAGACRYAEVTVATREALTIAGRCQPGDILALVEGEVNVVGSDLPQTCLTLLDRMLAAGGEMVTLVLGADAPAGLGEAVERHVHAQRPYVEVQCYDGGQPHYPLLVGVE